MNEQITSYLNESIRVKTRVLNEQSDVIARMAECLIASVNQGGTLYAMGNGGSASDAQHMVAEFVGRFRRERRALPAMALTPNSSTVTAIANDYGYEQIFARQIEAFCKPEDVVLAISTSGRSANVIEAVNKAREIGATVLALVGEPGEPLGEMSDHCLRVPAKETCHVQEVHIAVIHILCELVESHCCERIQN